jgi:hypothetical protein
MTIPTDSGALARFAEYFRKNYPGPDTIISDPDWHAPKIFNAAIDALRSQATPSRLPTNSHRQALALGLELVAPGTYQVCQPLDQGDWLPIVDAARAIGIHPQMLAVWTNEKKLTEGVHWKYHAFRYLNKSRYLFNAPAISALIDATCKEGGFL